MNLERIFSFGGKLLFGTAITIALSCGGGKGKKVVNPIPPSEEEGTGVEGLNTPSEILSNPYVEEIINETKEEGLTMTPEQGVHPPVISGTYEMNGWLYIPYHAQLYPGTWRWYKQTSDNHINTDYNQGGFQSGTSAEGEIIRGEGNEFTVYSIIDVTTGEYKDRGVMLVDGIQDDEGNVNATYVITPTSEDSYYAPSAGSLELTLTGGAKIADGNTDGYFLMSLKYALGHNK